MRISQAAHYRYEFGTVLRSSAIFYCRQSVNMRSRFSVLDYWRLKRGISVILVTTLRDMQGRLIERQSCTLTESAVLTVEPIPSGWQLETDGPFEGSWELEAFATQSMVIPYAAVMAFYETLSLTGNIRTQSVVHSYTRVYSAHELEDAQQVEGRVITDGHEGCWSLRDDAETRSFAICHNGGYTCPPQIVQLIIQNHQGETRHLTKGWPALHPYQTLRIEPADLMMDLTAFLNGQPGYASLHFRLEGSFTRLMTGHRRLQWDDIQVTHSNFDYSTHETDKTAQDESIMMVPYLERDAGLLVYPHSSAGQYRAQGPDGHEYDIMSGRPFHCHAVSGEWRFFSVDGTMPSRLVTGLQLDNGLHLSSECSLGVVHAQRPAKHFWWLPVTKTSRLHMLPMTRLFPLNEASSVQLSLYIEGQVNARYVRQMTGNRLNGLTVLEIFPGWDNEINDDLSDIAWLTLENDYGGYMVLGQYGATNSQALEHGF